MPRTKRTRATRTTLILLLAAVLATFSFAGCTASGGPSTVKSDSSAAYPVTLTDDAGRVVTINAEPKRIVSLAPANTEILFALGLGDRVVGVTTYDDYPAEVSGIAKVGDFQTPNLEAIAAAKPDLILATTGVQADMVKRLEALGAVVIAIDPQDLAGVYTDIERVGKATGTASKATSIVEGMKADVVSVQKAVAGKPKVTAFVEIGQNPLYTVGKGTFIDELITLAGGTNVVTEKSYVAYSSEQLIAANPQVYLATKGSSSDPASIEKRAGFDKLSAVKNGRVVILDDNTVSRPGPRLIEGLKQIAMGLHPEAF
ncbi:MAG: cobalamin-binding protein [Coriobacteriia bacterium]|nr:cobalamin-binding protein [Coriobacteriia bacterium]